jgi:hypothetical protein
MEKKRNDMVADAYTALNLAPGASTEEVKAAYDSALREAGQDDRGWKRAKEIGSAFEILGTHVSGGPGVASRHHQEAYTNGAHPLKTLFLPAPRELSAVSYWPRVCFFLVMAVWGAWFIFAPVEGDYVGRSFMHLINLPFHEAGHLLLAFLGDFMRVLGGTLVQVIVPLVCLIAFLKQAEPFGAACCLWWTGQSFIDAAPYIYDARAGQLMLLGGTTGQDNPDFHDWHNMLARLGLLQYDHAFAYAAKSVGVSLLILSLAWGAWVLFREYKVLREPKIEKI